MSKLDPEQKKRLIQDAMKNMKFAQEKQTPFDILLAQLQTTSNEVQQLILPVLKSGGWTDKEALRLMLYDLYLPRLSRFSKQELEVALSLLLVAKFMHELENSPFGEGPVNAPNKGN